MCTRLVGTIEKRAIEIAKRYERRHGRVVVDFQRAKRGFRGFDLLSFSKDRKDVRSIEVKGTQINKRGNALIPIVYETGFTRTKKLVATHLYLVVFSHGLRARFLKLVVFRAEEIKTEFVREERHYRVNLPAEVMREKMRRKTED